MNIVESKWIREIWGSPTRNKDYLRGRLDFALENIESDFREKLARLDATWTAPRDVFQDVDGTASLDELYFPDGIVGDRPLATQIDDALQNGKHIILTGPPGSGKTKIAQIISEHYVGDDYTLTTATDDWSTFDTIGGYRPSRNRDDSLKFTPGIFLQRFLDPSPVPEPKNEWLIIDELNRADIDKAFGSLFSVFTGNTVTLPFENDDGSIVLVGDPSSEEKQPLTSRHYYIPDSWRLISTMNTDDKASLYKMSYAFMRRFAFISVPVPDSTDIDFELVAKYADLWDFDFEENILEDITEIWRAIQNCRIIGPALIKDILSQIQSQDDSEEIEYAYAVRMYVVPQLEGLPEREINGTFERINQNVDNFDRDIVKQFAEDYLDISLQE